MFRTQFPLACLLAMSLLVFPAGPAFAYIGPGAGLGAFAVILALGAGLLLLIVGLVWFPLKRLLKQNNVAQAQNETSEG